ncbi:TfoX/Sxy family protein [Mucilaginibacter terrae]|uniref:TfoX/Sxy family transcriptional regulator of competence genes n=1 Tax=Mucilaginibacter terrae TaxID=1955052 RepID=A0ABU3GRP8_9SPHI|nr:TfoX/Sxy family protein [Mucilaginibacter terrae]MDT3402452.1 TfoX/Sxy family transcriptional regulator of competence genes [Mucilaginibacter terrae]
MFNSSTLTNIIREALSILPNIDEKRMFGGTCFMVDDKMCICVSKHHLLCRIGEERAVVELENDTCRQMIHGGRLMKDYVYVDFENLRDLKHLNRWIDLCLDYNPQAKASKKQSSI